MDLSLTWGGGGGSSPREPTLNLFVHSNSSGPFVHSSGPYNDLFAHSSGPFFIWGGPHDPCREQPWLIFIAVHDWEMMLFTKPQNHACSLQGLPSSLYLCNPSSDLSTLTLLVLDSIKLLGQISHSHSRPHSFAILTSSGLKLCINWLHSYSIFTLFIVNLTDFTSKIWQLCSITSPVKTSS